MTATKDHIPALDGLRGCAALVVVVKHMSDHHLLVGPDVNFLGAFGVTLFFCLSGFLISFLYTSRSFNPGNVVQYGLSRFSRIAPAYLLIVVCSFIIVRYFDPDFIYQITGTNLLRHLLFTGNVSVLWSIPPEIQLYFFFIACWWATQKYLEKKRFPIFLVGAACVAMVLVEKHVPGTTLPSKVQLFILGAAAGHVRAIKPMIAVARLSLGAAQALCFVGLLLGAAYLFHDAVALHRDAFNFPDEAVYFSLPYCVLCALTVLTLSYRSDSFDLLFTTKPMRQIGFWSFSIYLLHEPFLQLAERSVANGNNEYLAVGISLVATFILAALVYAFVERPSQQGIKKIANRLVPARVAVP